MIDPTNPPKRGVLMANDAADEFDVTPTPAPAISQAAPQAKPAKDNPAKPVISPLKSAIKNPQIAPVRLPVPEKSKVQEAEESKFTGQLPDDIASLIIIVQQLSAEPPTRGNRKAELARLAKLQAAKAKMFSVQQGLPSIDLPPLQRTSEKRLRELAAKL